MKKNSLFYILTIIMFGLTLWFVLEKGTHLESTKLYTASTPLSEAASEQPHFFSNIQRNANHPLAILIIQIFCIMITARLFGFLMSKIGQPSVVGEIAAGIALGPSLLGFFMPEFSQFLFPDHSLKRLHVLSQIGLVLFMFIVGMELDISVLKKQAKAAVIISYASIIFPFFLGVLLAYFIYPLYAPITAPFIGFALFIGIAMSITAFPVLARIVQERHQTHTPLGTTVITCAAANDVIGWCLLAFIIATVAAGGMISAIGSIVMSIIYVLFMWFAVKPVLHRVAIKYDTPESINKTIVAFIFGIILLSSYMTEVIGIHALFGAFLAGVIMPPQKEFKRILSEKVEDISLVLLLPLFFVFTGLRTHIGLLNQTHLWGIFFLILAVAIVGKLAGSALAAKITGQSWKDSLLIGILMNTRGLMELIILNIGYDLGILSVEIFTMMVLMALITTFMTGPAINAIELLFRPKTQKTEKKGFCTMISFGSPQSGGRLLELACNLNLQNTKDSSIIAAHFSSDTDISIIDAEQYEKEAFEPINRKAEALGIMLKKITGVTDNVEKEIAHTAQGNACDIILVGSSRELFTDKKTGGKVKSLLKQENCSVGVFIDKRFKRINRVFFIFNSINDFFLLKYAKQICQSKEIKETFLLDPNNLMKNKPEAFENSGLQPHNVLISADNIIDRKEPFNDDQDIVVIGLPFWKNLKARQDSWLKKMPSVLIIKDSQSH